MLSKIRVAKLYDTAKVPTRKHPTDAGLDLYICHGHGGVFKPALKPGEVATYGTGITVEIPEGFVGLVWPKSRSNFLIGGGVIDAGYQGEILVKVINVSRDVVMVGQDQAVAQLIIQPVETPEVEEIPLAEIHQEKSERGVTGGIVTEWVDMTKEQATWHQEQFFPSNLEAE